MLIMRPTQHEAAGKAAKHRQINTLMAAEIIFKAPSGPHFCLYIVYESGCHQVRPKHTPVHPNTQEPTSAAVLEKHHLVSLCLCV